MKSDKVLAVVLMVMEKDHCRQAAQEKRDQNYRAVESGQQQINTENRKTVKTHLKIVYWV
jgi:hypothetical protein